LSLVRIQGTLFFQPWRCIANNTKKKGYPAYTELSSKKCLDCEANIKLKHIQKARDGGYKPPDRCYGCLCKQKKKQPLKLRKLARAKQRERERKGLPP